MGPGDPAAHGTDCLPLLPSGSGGVHRVPLHRAQPLFLVLDLQYPFRCLSARRNYETAKRAGGRHEVRYGGEGGIRTHGPVAGTHAFQACRFVHSRTSPHREVQRDGILACMSVTGKVTAPPVIVRFRRNKKVILRWTMVSISDKFFDEQRQWKD